MTGGKGAGWPGEIDGSSGGCCEEREMRGGGEVQDEREGEISNLIDGGSHTRGRSMC